MDLTQKVKSVSLVTKTSSKTGNDYRVLEVTFIDGYVYSQFLNNDQAYILSKIK